MQNLQLTAPAAVPTSYGIQRAIELMRALPLDDDPALVLRVVRKTLRSTGVSLEEIVSTARERETAIVKGIESDRAAIEQLEIQIATRRANITRLEGDLEETRDVRARIQEALESETKIGGSLTPDEVMRIRAEAAEKSRAPKPPKRDVPAPPSSDPAGAAKPTPTAPPVPVAKKFAPVLPSKPPPKVPSAISQPPAPLPPPPPPKRDMAPKQEAKSDAKPDPAPAVTIGARRGELSSIPDIGEIDDGFDDGYQEQATAEIEVPVVRGRSGESSD
jgi:hypothetical protein